MPQTSRLGDRAALAVALTLATMALAARGETPETLVLLGSEPTESEQAVDEAEWAAELAGALGLTEALAEEHRAEELFALLCADRAELVTEAGGRLVPGRSALRVSMDAPRPRRRGEPIRMVAFVPATALYQLTVQGVGAQRWSVDRRPIGHVDPSRLGVGQVPAILPLREGPHELTATLTRRARVERVEFAAYRPLCIAPSGGWRAGRPLRFSGKARTLVHALGLERRLPVDDEAIPIEGERFASASATGGRTNRRLAVPASANAWATAAESPSEFTYRVHLARPGLFTLMARVHGPVPQIWSVDGRYRVTVHLGSEAEGLVWAHVLTLELTAGDHAIRALLPRGSGIDLLRLVRRRASDADYLAVLEEAGFSEGAPDELVTHSAARANLSNPSFAALAEDFFPRLAGVAPGEPLALVEDELEKLYSRPLSPVLPPEL